MGGMITGVPAGGSAGLWLPRQSKILRISTTVRSLIRTGPFFIRYRSTSAEKDSFRYHLAKVLVRRFVHREK
jgi:hypothetical protein